MSPTLRQSLSALGFVAIVAALTGGGASAALDLWTASRHVDDLEQQAQALEARARRAAPAAHAAEASPFIDAATITLAGAALQQRLESAVEAAGGRLTSSKVDVGGRGDAARALKIGAELNIAQPDLQKLLYDLESGRPYLFLDAFEARAPERAEGAGQGLMHVSMTVSGEWGGPK